MVFLIVFIPIIPKYYSDNIYPIIIDILSPGGPLLFITIMTINHDDELMIIDNDRKLFVLINDD